MLNCSCVETEVCVYEVNDAALYCNDSNDDQCTRAHLEASHHTVKRRGQTNMGER